MTSFGRQISLLAQRSPDATALVHVAPDGRDTTITWSELERRSNQVAHLLATRGVDHAPPEGHDPGGIRLVAIALPNVPEHFFACYATWKLGATVLPLRWDLPSWERDRLLVLGEAQCGGRRLGRRTAGNDLDGRAVGLDGARRDRAARPGGRARAGTRHVGIHRRGPSSSSCPAARRPRRWCRSGRRASSRTTRSNSS